MIFRDCFSDKEISTYSLLAAGVHTIQSREDFDEFVMGIVETLDGAEPEDVARFILLGIVMGAHLVAKVAEENEQAKSN